VDNIVGLDATGQYPIPNGGDGIVSQGDMGYVASNLVASNVANGISSTGRAVVI
jgi:hypothetical protein